MLKSTVKEISHSPLESFQKFEWNIREIKNGRNISQNLIQFRGLGVRVKKHFFSFTCNCWSANSYHR